MKMILKNSELVFRSVAEMKVLETISGKYAEYDWNKNGEGKTFTLTDISDSWATKVLEIDTSKSEFQIAATSNALSGAFILDSNNVVLQRIKGDYTSPLTVDITQLPSGFAKVGISYIVANGFKAIYTE